jgi:hypothetical protein
LDISHIPLLFWALPEAAPFNPFEIKLRVWPDK